MRTLDAVYNTFANLEKNYAKSSKSRSQYVIGKFGGDINVGSFLILHALSKEVYTDPDDIEKLSVIREVFSNIKAHEDSLDSLSSFNFGEESAMQQCILALSQGEYDGTGISAVDQKTMWTGKGKPSHYAINAKVAQVVALSTAPYYNLYSPAMTALVNSFCGGSFEVGDIVASKLGGRVQAVDKPAYW